MTDEEIEWNEGVLEEFRAAGWRPPFRRDTVCDIRENIPEGYEFVPPRHAWDIGHGPHPPITSVPCIECGKPSEPYCRYEFKRDDDDVVGWSTGIALFAYECDEHGLFINQAIERKRERIRNGRATVS